MLLSCLLARIFGWAPNPCWHIGRFEVEEVGGAVSIASALAAQHPRLTCSEQLAGMAYPQSDGTGGPGPNVDARGDSVPTSRLCIKNIPKYANEIRLREHFSKKGEVTDVRVVKTR